MIEKDRGRTAKGIRSLEREGKLRAVEIFRPSGAGGKKNEAALLGILGHEIGRVTSVSLFPLSGKSPLLRRREIRLTD